MPAASAPAIALRRLVGLDRDEARRSVQGRRPAARATRAVSTAAVIRSRRCSTKRPIAIDESVLNPSSAAAAQGHTADSFASDGHSGERAGAKTPAVAATPATKSAAAAPAAQGGSGPASDTSRRHSRGPHTYAGGERDHEGAEARGQQRSQRRSTTCQRIGSVVFNCMASDGHMTAMLAIDAAKPIAKRAPWPGCRRRCAGAAHAGHHRRERGEREQEPPAILAIVCRPERSRSARSQSRARARAPGTDDLVAREDHGTRASPSLPTSTRGSANTNDQSVRAGRSFSSAATGVSAAGSSAEARCAVRSASACASPSRGARPAAPRAADAEPAAPCRRVDRDPPLLGPLRDVAVEHRVAHVPQRRRERRCRRARDTPPAPLRATRTDAASTAPRRSPRRTVEKRRHSGPSVDAARGERRVGRGFGGRAIDRERRDVGLAAA